VRHNRLRHVSAVLGLGLVLALLFAGASASAAPPRSIDTTGASLYTFDAVQWCPNSTVISSWSGTRGGDIPLGAFDRNGRVTGGAAVLAMRVEMGTAPLSSLAFGGTTDAATGQTISVTPAKPTASGTVNAAGLNWNEGLAFQPQLTTVANGSGSALVHFALLTRRNESWKKAPGVTVPLNVVVGQCLGATGSQTERALTNGGGR